MLIIQAFHTEVIVEFINQDETQLEYGCFLIFGSNILLEKLEFMRLHFWQQFMDDLLVNAQPQL